MKLKGFNRENDIKHISENELMVTRNNFYLSSSDIEHLLKPLLEILNGKNITDSFFYRIENNKLYCCFKQSALSDFNRKILYLISEIYSETIFYSDDEVSPNTDRLEYWPLSEDLNYLQELYNRCINKRIIVFECDINDSLMIMGGTIMLANMLQIQDPLTIPVNKDKEIYSAEELARHDTYLEAGSPDQNWFQLTVVLSRNNPLRDNFYAPTLKVANINSLIECDNIIAATFVGCENKIFLTFKLDEEDLVTAIEEYMTVISLEAKNILLKFLNPSARLLLEKDYNQ